MPKAQRAYTKLAGPSFQTLLLIQFFQAFAKGCFETQLNPDIIELIYTRVSKKEYYQAHSQVINAALLLSQLFGQVAGAALLPVVRARLTYKRASLCFLGSFCVVEALMLVPVNAVYVFCLMVFGGLTTSVNSQIVLLWIGEIAQAKFRGILGVIYEISIGVGNIANSAVLAAVNYAFRMRSTPLNIYNANFAPALAGALLCLLCEIPVPDGLQGAAVDLAAKGVQMDATAEIIAEGIDQNEANAPQKRERRGRRMIESEVSYRQIFCERRYRKALALSVFVGIWQQSTGICGICSFATLIFATYFNTPLSSAFGAIIVMSGKTLGTIPVIFLIERLGRKVLIMIGCAGCCVGLVLIIVAYAVVGLSVAVKDVLLMTGVIVYLVGFSIGAGPCCHVLNSEIYPRCCKGKLSGLGMVLFFITYGLVVGLFEATSPDGSEYIVYACYLACIVVFTGILLALLPETKNKSNAEIEDAVLLR